MHTLRAPRIFYSSTDNEVGATSEGQSKSSNQIVGTGKTKIKFNSTGNKLNMDGGAVKTERRGSYKTLALNEQ